MSNDESQEPEAPHAKKAASRKSDAGGARPERVSPGASDAIPVRLGELEDRAATGAAANFPSSLLDQVMLDVSIELGRVQLPFRRIRGLSQGAVVELERPVGDPLDVRVNGRLVARGEVVAIKGERYGIRLTEVVRQEENAGSEA